MPNHETWLSKNDISEKKILQESSSFDSTHEFLKQLYPGFYPRIIPNNHSNQSVPSTNNTNNSIHNKSQSIVLNNSPGCNSFSNSTISSKKVDFINSWGESDHIFIQARSGSYDEVKIIKPAEKLPNMKDSKILDFDIPEEKYPIEELAFGDVSKETAEINLSNLVEIGLLNLVDAISLKSERNALVALRNFKEEKSKFNFLISTLKDGDNFLIDYAFDNNLPSIGKLLMFYSEGKYENDFIYDLIECIVMQDEVKAQRELSRLTENKDSCKTLAALLNNECSYLIDLAHEKELKYLKKKMVYFRDLDMNQISEDNDIAKFGYKETKISSRRTRSEAVGVKIKQADGNKKLANKSGNKSANK